MDEHSTAQIVALVCLVAMSAFFSASETAFSSLNRIRLKNRANNGSTRAARTLALSERYDALLSTILIGNNIVNIAASSIATVFCVYYWGDLGAMISTVATTVIVLIFGEISPKSLAKQHAEAVAVAVTPILSLLTYLFFPLNWLFGQWKKLLGLLFRSREEQQYTDEELITLVDEVQSEGSIDVHEGELIRAAIEFNDVEAVEILTPRIQITAIEDTASVEEVRAVFIESGYSRLPVYHESVDTIIGVLLEKDFFRSGDRSRWPEMVKQVVYVPPGTKISMLLRQLQKEKSHLAVIIDEFGGTYGIVTMEDILEELVGEIWDEHDQIEEDVQSQQDGSYLVAGDANREELFEELGLDEESEAVTVGGWVMERLGTIPTVGAAFEEAQWRITVTAVDGRRVEEIRIEQLVVDEAAETTE
ncbi:MAG: HlyC/CorC family transporter [Clostridia bacterium]|nr:HlyC/CorC family transporter [Clostridia bacterium]